MKFLSSVSIVKLFNFVNYKMLVTLNEEYNSNRDDVFSTMINNIVNPTGVLKYKELGYRV